MEFGVPKRREFTENKEKYPTLAVLTVNKLGGKKSARMITFNSLAIEKLGLDLDSNVAQVSFAFDKLDDSVAVANTSGLENQAEVRVAKTSKSVSDKSYFEALKKQFNVPVEDELELQLVENGKEYNGFPVFNLVKLEATDATQAVVDEAVAETYPVYETVENTSPEGNHEETSVEPANAAEIDTDFENVTETAQEGTEEAVEENVVKDSTPSGLGSSNPFDFVQ
jgi:hypothetical protein